MVNMSKLLTAAQIAVVFVVFVSVPSLITSSLMIIGHQMSFSYGFPIVLLSLFSILAAVVVSQYEEVRG